jgi:hypothetical protein
MNPTASETSFSVFATEPKGIVKSGVGYQGEIWFNGRSWINLQVDTPENDLDTYRMPCQLLIRSDRIGPNDALNRGVGTVSANFAN